MKRYRLSVLLLPVFAIGCSNANFSANKNALLAKSSVFSDASSSSGTGVSGSINQPPRPRTNVEGSIQQGATGSSKIVFDLLCSDSRSKERANFKRALNNDLPLELMVGGEVCTSKREEIAALVSKKSFDNKDAGRLCPSLVPANGKLSGVSLEVDGTSNAADKGVIELLYALNDDESPANEVADEKCDETKSPLVIHISSDVTAPKAIALSSQADGIWFDLLGQALAHTPVKISWFTNTEYGFLALPDVYGQVKGIDQLFGNRTVGPDGLFADDGYAALAKYDENSDGFINAEDAVFASLRVWTDKSFDGKAQSRELRSLRQAGITFVDLKYSTDFAETDQYGNKTLMKSVVGLSDGSLDLIFDLWFAYQVGE
jgi:hypothetical protein